MRDHKITILGLGYVGLPLAVEFAKKFKVVGFDIDKNRIRELNSGVDKTLEVSGDHLKGVLSETKDSGLLCSDSIDDILDSNVYIVTVPTPIDKSNKPDLTPLYKASETVGKVLKKGDIVVYESTVFPGATEEECVPILENASELTFNKDFYCGYSPERINPGDKEHTVAKILKITSGSTPDIAEQIDQLYKSVITAGTYKASCIKVAEAAKVIENTQRDINIAFVNELAKIFQRLGIDTSDVLEAAGTKWNFLPFKPGLVGGHCIGVDPYYLAQKAEEVGYHPEIILAGRRINNEMGAYVAKEFIKQLIKKGKKVKDCRIMILGITFKENCPDIRNTRVIDVIRELEDFNVKVDVYDPWANSEEVKDEFNISLKEDFKQEEYDGIILAVAHSEFKNLTISNGNSSVWFDIKSYLPKDEMISRL